jgi:hypothetical protein
MKPSLCLKCKHYFVTFDPLTPHGCRTFQLKSRQMPDRIVHTHSEEECHGFAPKQIQLSNQSDSEKNNKQKP